MRGRPGPALRLALSAGSYRFRESLFLLPLLLVAVGIVLALVAAALDRSLGADPIPMTLGMSSNAAIWLLSTVAGATITTVGVVFSLTVVSLQLASSQFSPRVMRSFIRDRVSQVVIGMLVSTFVYCVLTLPNISGEASEPAPRISLTVAVVLTVVTVVLIIAHLDHLARRLQVGHVARDIAAEGHAVIDAMLRAFEEEQRATDHELEKAPVPPDAFTVEAALDGWISQVDTKGLLAAVPPGTTVRLETRIGAYIHRGEPLVLIWPRPDDGEAVARRVGGDIVISDARTMQQDVDFAIRQLVDIGLRALSSAINDPSTAIEIILRIGSLLRRLLLVPPLPRAVVHDDGRVLVRPWDLDQEEYIEHGFDQLRQAAPSQPNVAAALLRVLRMLISHVQQHGLDQYVPALQDQIDLLLDALRDTPHLHPDDLARLEAMASEKTDPADHSLRRVRD
ncbi:putative membrane protein [Georgenia soli]|uniref:Putative membrane protein n=1 Tax=Georgenia soli TaxID=638953 RepID=A0A2A9EJ73_9MICO|nr:DUF2254 domain-containing protein [Georgenia soli]PFG38958.1 putative membrane protein [Georgenia soli]